MEGHNRSYFQLTLKGFFFLQVSFLHCDAQLPTKDFSTFLTSHAESQSEGRQTGDGDVALSTPTKQLFRNLGMVVFITVHLQLD